MSKDMHTVKSTTTERNLYRNYSFTYHRLCDDSDEYKMHFIHMHLYA